MTRGFTIAGLGEIAIRCIDPDAMGAFYGDILGLERLHGDHGDDIRFFRIAPGVAGHTVVLALFNDAAAVAGARSSLHHLAFAVTRGQQDAATAWFDACGVPWRAETFEWIGWRGIFVTDPEGNTVELVARDPSLPAPGV